MTNNDLVLREDQFPSPREELKGKISPSREGVRELRVLHHQGKILSPMRKHSDTGRSKYGIDAGGGV